MRLEEQTCMRKLGYIRLALSLDFSGPDDFGVGASLSIWPPEKVTYLTIEDPSFFEDCGGILESWKPLKAFK